MSAAALALAPDAGANNSGRTGHSGNPGVNGGATCVSCHGGSSFVYATPALSGPTSVQAASSNAYTLTFGTAGVAAPGAGFNLSATAGTLADPNTGDDPVQKSGAELTHAGKATGTFSWSFSWTAPGAAGTYKFYYCANPVNNNGASSGDGAVSCGSTDITVTAAPGNNPPTVANPIANQAATEDSAFSFTFDANTFADADGDALTYSSPMKPAWLAFSPTTRTFSGTPANANVGSSTVQVTATDGAGASVTDDFILTVTNVNDAPDAVNDAFSVTRNSSNNTLGVRANDTDADLGDTLTITAVGTPGSGGNVVIAGGGASLNYTPASNFSGTETFTYTIQDAGGLSDTATVTVTVVAPPPANSAPVAANDSYSTNEDVPLAVPAAGVLANDTDADANSLGAVLVSNPARGTLALSANGAFTYTPNANANGPDSFTYRASDGMASSNIATATITVNAVADAPTAVNDSYATNEDMTLVVAGPGVLGNDMDADGNALTAALVAGPASGMLALNANGGFTYAPNANFSGNDSFTYRANDGTQNSAIATVSITVGVQNDAPAAAADSYSTAHNTPLAVAAPGVLANDSDADGNALSAVLVSAPASGMVGLDPDGSFTYTPNAGFAGNDSFTYQASDGMANSSVVAVGIAIAAAASSPAPPPAGGDGGGGGGSWSWLGALLLSGLAGRRWMRSGNSR